MEADRRRVLATGAAMGIAVPLPAVAVAQAAAEPEASQVRLERKGGLVIASLANPNGNRINYAVLVGMRNLLAAIRQPGVRALLIKGDGPVFSYGADVSEFAARPPDNLLPLMQEYVDILGAFEASGIPTLAAVHGVCSSGGLELALAFDQLWAASGTQIGFLEANIATPPLAGGVQRLAARAGHARAFEIATAGRLYDAAQFERWNIVNRVLPAETLFSEAEAFAARWAAGPTLAYGGVKTLLREWDKGGVSATDRITIATVAPIMGSQDARSAISTILKNGPTRPQTVFEGR